MSVTQWIAIVALGAVLFGLALWSSRMRDKRDRF